MTKRLTLDDVKAIREKFENEVAGMVSGRPDLSLDEIAEMFGLDRKEVYRIRQKRNLPTRRVRNVIPAEKELPEHK